MFENEPAKEDFEDFINTENGIVPNFTDDTETSSDEHVNKLEELGMEVLNMTLLWWETVEMVSNTGKHELSSENNADDIANPN